MTKKITAANVVDQVELLRKHIKKFDKDSKDFLSGFAKESSVYPAPNVSEEVIQEFFNGISAVNKLMNDTVNPKMEKISNEFNR
jgi:7,8-dihydro-6-hydroxymethylpterin-pyrophosphokinase